MGSERSPFLCVPTLAALALVVAAGRAPAAARRHDAAPARVHLPLVARALSRGDLPDPVVAPPSEAPTDTPATPPAPTPTATPTTAACASLADRVTVASSDVGPRFRANDEYNPLVVAPRPDGGSLVAWRAQAAASVRVGTFDARGVLIGMPLSFAAEEVHALVAHDDGGALVVVDDDRDIYSPKYCRGPTTPDKALCGKLDVWRFDDAGQTVWRRTVTGKTNVDRDGAEFVWWYAHTARLAWTGDGYGLYYRNAMSAPRPGAAGEIDIHAGDAFRLLGADGSVRSHAWRWGCSHSWAVRLAFNGHFATACHGDAYPNAFHVVVADPDRLRGEANLHEGVDPTKRALGGLVGDPDGFWLLHMAQERTAGSPMRLSLARIDNDGAVVSDTVVGEATDLETAYPFRPYLAAYGDDALLAGWMAGGALRLAVLSRTTGALIEGPASVPVAIDRWVEFVSYADGDVGWAWAPGGGTRLDMVRVAACR